MQKFLLIFLPFPFSSLPEQFPPLLDCLKSEKKKLHNSASAMSVKEKKDEREMRNKSKHFRFFFVAAIKKVFHLQSHKGKASQRKENVK